MNKITAIIIGIIILCFGGLVTLSILSSQSGSSSLDSYDTTSIILPTDSNGQIGDHVRGDANSPVIFVEYADFQCPGCASIYPKINTLFEEYGDRVAFVFRHFPLNGHQNSRAAASAAVAASLQGHFFEMVDTLYSNQSVWSYASGAERTSIFTDLFQQVSINGDATKFRSDMSSPEVSKKISFDYDLGFKKDKVTGTPSFFINGEYVDLSNSATSSDFLATMREKLDIRLAEFNLPTGPVTDNSDSDSDSETES